MSFFYIRDDAGADPSYGSDVVVLVVSGELDYSASPHLRERIFDHVKADKRRLVVDLSAVTFIDSMAIGAENERVLRIFDIAGVASSIPLHRSHDEALSALLASPSAEVPAWISQATAVAAHAPPLPASPSGLSAARKYAEDASADTRSRHAADRRHLGGEIDQLA
jgi:anti-sigma B factor antagonist